VAPPVFKTYVASFARLRRRSGEWALSGHSPRAARLLVLPGLELGAGRELWSPPRFACSMELLASATEFYSAFPNRQSALMPARTAKPPAPPALLADDRHALERERHLPLAALLGR
jgi:hypothetical protein